MPVHQGTCPLLIFSNKQVVDADDPYIDKEAWEEEEAMLAGGENEKGETKCDGEQQQGSAGLSDGESDDDRDSDLLWAVSTPWLSRRQGSSGSALRSRRAELR